MSSVFKLVLSFAFTAFGPFAFAEVNFSSYVKRNHEVLKTTKSDREVVAFEKKVMFRDVASVPSEEKKLEPTKSDAPTPDVLQTPASAPPTNDSSDSSQTTGPGR